MYARTVLNSEHLVCTSSVWFLFRKNITAQMDLSRSKSLEDIAICTHKCLSRGLLAWLMYNRQVASMSRCHSDLKTIFWIYPVVCMSDACVFGTDNISRKGVNGQAMAL
jgi:hypothetical protein